MPQLCAYDYVTMTVSTGRDSDKFMLRFPDGMRDRLKQAAAENNRSMNAEIIARLEASLGKAPSIDETGAPIVTADIIPGSVWAKFAELVATVEENSKDIKTLIEKTRSDK